MTDILLIHGPNINLLGQREPEVYGTTTLPQVNAAMTELAAQLGVSLSTFQSNCEGEIIDTIHQAKGKSKGIVINPGGLTHTSVCLRDAFASVAIPFVEVHMSNISARESFRKQSFLSPIALGTIYGFGVDSYYLGLRAICSALEKS